MTVTTMAEPNYFSARPAVRPTIYVYRLPGVASHEGYVKVGFTDRDVETRINEQLHTSGVPHETLLTFSAIRPDGSCFTDRDVHAVLKRRGYPNLYAGEDRNEWFRCTWQQVRAACIAVRDETENAENRHADFGMRPEQYRAVEATMRFFASAKDDDPTGAPKFLWNAKMRFGKTFAAYELAKKMGAKKVLVLTFKPAVEAAWREDLVSHVDFEGWQFVSNKDANHNDISIDRQFALADKTRPIVVFGSFQDLLGTNEAGGIKAKNQFIHDTNWNLVIFDEYHFGAWRENAKKLFETPDEEAGADFNAEQYKLEEADNAINETWLPITTDYYLYLSGTPFRAINSGEFIEEQIFNWTYSDEQKAKAEWVGSGNPYAALPRMVMMTYRIPDAIRRVAQEGEFDEFDLNVFFSAKAPKNHPEQAEFVYKNEVQKWLDLMRGSYIPQTKEELKVGEKPPMPYSDARLLGVLQHTFWFLPNVASCFAMKNLLDERQNTFYHDYRVIVCAGTQAGIGLDALQPVLNAMGDPLETKTITLSCGKLSTGVTVRPWSGVFMLRNLKSPETYFQTAFRGQSPWTVKDEAGNTVVLKNDCYVFDFALDRALHQIADYACQLSGKDGDPEKSVGEFIKFLPVLAYDGAKMSSVSAEDILDFTTAGTSATLLAKRWESALLVNVDNETLTKLLNNKEAMDALMKIEGFRSLNADIQTIINKSESIKKAKKEAQGELPPKKKKELSDEEKEMKSKRKQIQEKLIKFATRVPVFMYLSEYRERCLKDVITLLEPRLFKLTTGLDVKDFDLLCSLGVFNAETMNQAIWQFKRYEDASLVYTGVDRHAAEQEVGGWDTVIRRDEFDEMFNAQQKSMAVVRPAAPTFVNVDPQPARPVSPPPVRPQGNTVQPQRTVNAQGTVTPIRPTPQPVAPVSPYANAGAVGGAYAVQHKTPAAQTQPKVEVDVSDIKPGTVVVHKIPFFGEGVVDKIDAKQKYIFVKFKGGSRRFTFPDIFENGTLRKK